jgi:hypothetical protein
MMKKATRFYLLLFVGSFVFQAMMPDTAVERDLPQAGARTMKTTEGPKNDAELADMFPDTGDYTIVPPTQSPFLVAWSGLKTLDNLYYPVYGLLESMEQQRLEKGLGQVTTADLDPDLLYVQGDTTGSTEPYHAVYSDVRLLDDGTTITELPPLAYLRWAIQDTFAAGVAFNPASRVCDKQVFNYFINKHGLAEVIGYLEADTGDDRGQPFHELALAASERGDHYQVLYYWARSYREPRHGDDWTLCELAKLQAYHAVDYPGSMDRALSELEWFLGEHGSTPEREALLATLRQG